MYWEAVLNANKANIKMYFPYPKRLIKYLWELYLHTHIIYPYTWKKILDYVKSLESEAPEGYVDAILNKLQEKIDAHESLNKPYDIGFEKVTELNEDKAKLPYKYQRLEDLLSALKYTEEEQIVLKDKIKKFVGLLIDENIQFPKIYLLEDNEYLKAVQHLIKNENIYIDLNLTNKLINSELTVQVVDKFEKSFLEENPNLSPQEKDIQEWINAYIDTFEDDLTPINEFLVMLQKENILINNFEIADKKSIYQLIEKTIQNSSIIKLADSIASAMEEGKKINTKEIITLSDIDKMTGADFEKLLAKIFEAKGYNVKLTKTSNDQGADLLIEKFGVKTIIQAKRYSACISNSAIQEAVAAKAYYDCKNAMVITNNYFTKPAINLALSNNVELWDRDELKKQLKLQDLDNKI